MESLLRKENNQSREVYSPERRKGPRHVYLQWLIKRLSENYGFKVILNTEIAGGGTVDVVLEKAETRIACLIISDIPEKYEIIGLIRNCLANGYNRVVVVSPDKKILRRVKGLLFPGIDPEDQERLSFFDLDEFFRFIEAGDSVGGTVAGYRVKVRYRHLSEGEERARRREILKVVIDSLKKFKNQ